MRYDIITPLCVIITIQREYRAVMTKLVPMRVMEIIDHENVDRTINSSPIRLIVGSKTRLVRRANSHHAAIRGIGCRPQAKL